MVLDFRILGLGLGTEKLRNNKPAQEFECMERLPVERGATSGLPRTISLLAVVWLIQWLMKGWLSGH